MSEQLETLRDAKLWLQERLPVGAKCPCCTQFAKVYTRKLNSGMAASLLVIYRRAQMLNPTDGWLHIPRDFIGMNEKLALVLGNREYARLRCWGLLEHDEGPNEHADTKGSGVWRLTPLGVDFALGRVKVPRSVTLYDNRIVTMDTTTTSIQQALGARFSYEELMQRAAL